MSLDDSLFSEEDKTGIEDAVEALEGAKGSQGLDLFRQGERETSDRARGQDLFRQGERNATRGEVKSTLERVTDQTMDAFGDGFAPSFGADNTQDLIEQYYNDSRPDTPPPSVGAIECRIGLSKFYVPPINISVNSRFKSGSLSNGAVRRRNSPKTNTGNKETVITMTLFFPNVEQVYGSGTISSKYSNDETIDRYAATLKGFIAQFKYSPFLPVRNLYLNETHGITGVTLKSLTISNVEGFPGVVSAQVQMYKFNHKVFMPMIEDFNQAIHWGRYRDYFVRASIRSQNEVAGLKLKTLAEDGQISDPNLATSDLTSAVKTPEEILSENYGLSFSSYNKSLGLSQPTSQDARDFDFYYPFFSPSEISLPDLNDLLPDTGTFDAGRGWWDSIIAGLGLSDIATENFTSFYSIAENAKNQDFGFAFLNEDQFLVEYLRRTSTTVQEMSKVKLGSYIEERRKDLGVSKDTAAYVEMVQNIQQTWFHRLYRRYSEDTVLAEELANDERNRRNIRIQEWLVPMQKLELDPSIVHVQNVTVRMSNIISRMQLQMQDEPTHQHLGGEDTIVSIDLIIAGGQDGVSISQGVTGGGLESAEAQLIKLRRMFEGISGTARLAHSHGTLGFVGVKNPITELAGIKHAIPLNFEVQTIPNMPHAYSVNIQLLDFDVFQQNREVLDSTQQAHLTEQAGKHNPFMRIKQFWNLFSCYPDMPLAVKDDEGKIVGYLSPSYYFKSFKVIDGELMVHSDVPVDFVVGKNDGDDSAQVVSIYDDFSLGTNEDDEKYGLTDTESLVSGHRQTGDSMTPAAQHMEHYWEGSVANHVELMAKDMEFRDKGGSMIKAFPTYMLWLIDESGHFAGFKLFDNFYGLQSVIDMSLQRSENVMADTLMLRVSNMYSNLSTSFQGYLDENTEQDRIINRFTTSLLRAQTGTGSYILDVESISLRPGMRVHLRMGYSSNPNELEPVFNGTITEVEQGEIMNIIAQSDAVELGAIVNSSDTKGSSGKEDGNFANLYMSEPRDLMVTLLTQGSGVAKEVIANASMGQIFSENRHGIKHFGMMLYVSTNPERTKQDERRKVIERQLARLEKRQEGFVIKDVMGEAGSLYRDYYIGKGMKRDHEIFKRNIYPGNALGVGQFIGGDLGDVALRGASGIALPTAGLNQFGKFEGTPSNAGGDALEREESVLSKDEQPDDVLTLEEVLSGRNLPTAAKQDEKAKAKTDTSKGFSSITGLTRIDDDLSGIPEVSFRAQTYMKTVWDLFKTCAAMMPDYIVAVRPFEDRSTVFYGKPHWMYTSGVLPVTFGRDIGNTPQVEGPDEELMRNLLKASEEVENRSLQSLYERIMAGGAFSGSSGGSLGFVKNFDENASSVLGAFSAIRKINGSIVSLEGTGRISVEMHLPLSSDLNTDKAHHDQLDELPDSLRHPFYMDRIAGARGGEDSSSASFLAEGKSVLGEDGALAGQNGALGYFLEDSGFDGLSPQEAATYEKWYMNQRWRNPSGGSDGWAKYWRHARILVYSPDTKKGVICTPGEYGPAQKTGRVAGLSPDAFYAIGSPQDKVCLFRVMPDDYPLGPVRFNGEGVPIDMEQITSNLEDREQRSGQALRRPDFYRNLSGAFSGIDDVLQDDLGAALKYFGYRQDGIPVNATSYDEIDGKQELNFFDEEGFQAKEAYGEQRTDRKADLIWDQLRNLAWDQKENQTLAILEAFMGTVNTDNEEQAKAWLYNEDVSTLVDSYEKAVVDRAREDGKRDKNVAINSIVKGILAGSGYSEEVEYGSDPVEYRKSRAFILTDNFKRAMWENPYSRGWVVLVVNDRTIGDIPNLFTSATDSFNLELPGQAMGNFYSAGTSEYAVIESTPAMAFMRSNEKAGGIALFNALGSFTSGIKSSFSELAVGTLGFLRSNLLTTLNASINVFNAEANANTLNRAFDDSIYYSEGTDSSGRIVNPLLYAVDNPFTREYGEPVVELREPFQRIHHISSFQHILNNGIIESINNVATIVTAASNGEQPVTVHFDRNATSDRQVEKVVETGIYLSEEGFFSRVGNPINGIRDLAQSQFGDKVSDNILAKRIATAHLKESLKDIYQGEIIILGDASIRPYDLVYIADSYLKIFGFVEVEEVIHHFTPEMGFITTIKPNAVVTANDPARFYALASMGKKNALQAMRGSLRNSYDIRTDYNAYANNGSISLDAIARRNETTAVGTAQFVGGSSAALKSLIPNAVVKLSGVEEELERSSPSALAAATTTFLSKVASGMTGGIISGDIWAYIRDNALDQSACHINYLSKNGRPMDAGLNFAEGIAVGQMATRNLIIGGIGVAESAVETGTDGDPRINIGDVIPQLQYSQRSGVTQDLRDLNLFLNKDFAKLRALSGRQGNNLDIIDGRFSTYLAKIKKHRDADTLECQIVYRHDPSSGANVAHDLPVEETGWVVVRLAGVDAPEDHFKASSDEVRSTVLANTNDLGIAATEYTKSILPVGSEIVLRVSEESKLDSFGRVLAHVFHKAPYDIEEDLTAARNFKLNAASRAPHVPWDSFTYDGRPYTLDYELIVTGNGKTYIKDVTESVAGFTTGDKQ